MASLGLLPGPDFSRQARPLQRALVALALILGLALPPPKAVAEAPPSIAVVKSSIVAIGTFQATRVPQFRFLGTGFVVGDGTLAATNAHVLPATLDPGADPELLVAVLPGSEATRISMRKLARAALDSDHDLALMRIEGPALPALRLGDSASVVEGESLLFTGFPIGSVLGLFPATHRAMVAAIAPIALPSASGRQLDAKVIRRLRDSDVFAVFQLDATAYPGNSGSPLYYPETGEVVGIVNRVFVKGTKESVLSHPSGISYAVPSSYLADLLKRVRP